MTRTRHVLGLNMIRQPLAIFVSVRTLQAHVFPMLISSHFGGDQKVKITYKLQNYLITLVSMKSRLVNTQGIFGGAKLLTNITFIARTFHVLCFNMIGYSLFLICLVATKFAGISNVFHFYIMVQVFFMNACIHLDRQTKA